MRMNAEAIKGCAVGRWSEIIRSLAPHLSSMVERERRHGPCPLCGGKDRARCHNDFQESGGVLCGQCGGGADGLATLQWGNDWSFREALEAVASYLGLTSGNTPTPRLPEPKPQPKKDWALERKRLEKIWEQSEPNIFRLDEYFGSRGISIFTPPTLRLHSSLSYYHKGSPVSYPCMIAQIILDDEIVGLHRTWLDPDGFGKAPCSQPKKTWKCADSMTGGAIRLYDIERGKPLILTEGLETALAAGEITGLSVWSCVNSSMLEKVKLPENIESVIICGDKDRNGAGQRAAEKLAERLISEGREVKISSPPMEIPDGEKGVDWLDFLNAQEVEYAI